MCFSARVKQDLHKLSRRYNAEVAWDKFEDLFRHRLEGGDVKVSRALERNYDGILLPAKERTKLYIEQYAQERIAEWEEAIFKQRRRLVSAEESLKSKVTKTASEERRKAKKKIDTLLNRLADIRRQELREKDERIFPMTYAPVIVDDAGHRIIRPMRYTCRLAGKPANYDQRFPGTYNARRDSLDDYWKSLYGRRHAVMVVSGFYENVSRHVYEKRPLHEGEKLQNLVLNFNPQPETAMLVACLWDRWTDPSGNELFSFAALTDEPPEEVSATGHERCIIALQEENLHDWLLPVGLSADRLSSILDAKAPMYYAHQIAA